MLGGDKRFTKIHGLSDRRILPRMGKIRLGVKMVSRRTGNEYPKEVEYFVCPKEVQRVHGEKPTEIDLMFAVEDESVNFPQSYKLYVSNGLRCKGNNKVALRRCADLTFTKDGKVLDDAKTRLQVDVVSSDPNALVEIGCPCPLLDNDICSQKANLMVLLPKVSMSGVYQIDTGSIYNIIRINSAIDYIRSLVGRIALVPLILLREPQDVEHDGKKSTHYLLQLRLNANLEQVAQLRENARMILRDVERLALPAPVEDGPEPTGEVILVEEDEKQESSEKVVSPPEPPPPSPPTSTEQKVADLCAKFDEAQTEKGVLEIFQKHIAFINGLDGPSKLQIKFARDRRLTALKAPKKAEQRSLV